MNEQITVRCPKCSMGVDNLGKNIGYPVSSYRIGCQIEPSKSVLVAIIGRCTKPDDSFRADGSKDTPCGVVTHFKLMPEATRLELSKANILECCRHSKGNHFNLKELRQGYIDYAPPPNNYKEAQEVLSPEYTPDKYIEPEIELAF